MRVVIITLLYIANCIKGRLSYDDWLYFTTQNFKELRATSEHLNNGLVL